MKDIEQKDRVRVLNAVYSNMTEHNGQEPMSMLEFKQRKDIIKKQCKEIV